MRDSYSPFCWGVAPIPKRLIAFGGHKPTGQSNNSFSPLCLLATFTALAYLNGSKVMTSLEMRRSVLPATGLETTNHSADHQQTSFAFKRLSTVGPKTLTRD